MLGLKYKTTRLLLSTALMGGGLVTGMLVLPSTAEAVEDSRYGSRKGHSQSRFGPAVGVKLPGMEGESVLPSGDSRYTRSGKGGLLSPNVKPVAAVTPQPLRTWGQVREEKEESAESPYCKLADLLSQSSSSLEKTKQYVKTATDDKGTLFISKVSRESFKRMSPREWSSLEHHRTPHHAVYLGASVEKCDSDVLALLHGIGLQFQDDDAKVVINHLQQAVVRKHYKNDKRREILFEALNGKGDFRTNLESIYAERLLNQIGQSGSGDDWLTQAIRAVKGAKDVDGNLLLSKESNFSQTSDHQKIAQWFQESRTTHEFIYRILTLELHHYQNTDIRTAINNGLIKNSLETRIKNEILPRVLNKHGLWIPQGGFYHHLQGMSQPLFNQGGAYQYPGVPQYLHSGYQVHPQQPFSGTGYPVGVVPQPQHHFPQGVAPYPSAPQNTGHSLCPPIPALQFPNTSDEDEKREERVNREYRALQQHQRGTTPTPQPLGISKKGNQGNSKMPDLIPGTPRLESVTLTQEEGKWFQATRNWGPGDWFGKLSTTNVTFSNEVQAACQGEVSGATKQAIEQWKDNDPKDRMNFLATIASKFGGKLPSLDSLTRACQGVKLKDKHGKAIDVKEEDLKQLLARTYEVYQKETGGSTA